MDIQPELWTQLQAAWTATKSDPSVCGVDIGPKSENHPDVAVRLHVRSHQMSDCVRVAVSDHKAQVLFVDQGYAVTNPSVETKRSPHVPVLMSGQSCGVPDGIPGAITAIVIDETTGLPCLLTSAHVLLDLPGPLQPRVTQPSGGAQADVVASRLRSVCDLDGIAGIAPLTGDRSWLPVIQETYDTITAIGTVSLGDRLLRSTQTSGQTSAVVDGIGYYRIGSDQDIGKIPEHWMQGFRLSTLIAAPASTPSQSCNGALWYNPVRHRAVGLQVTRGDRAVACHMSQIAQRLDVRLASYDDLLEDIAAKNHTVGSAVGKPPAPLGMHAPQTLSVASQIWPQLSSALSSCQGLSHIEITPNTRVPATTGNQIAAAIAASPFFAATGLTMEGKDVASCKDFNDVLALLIIAIGDRGFSMVP